MYGRNNWQTVRYITFTIDRLIASFVRAKNLVDFCGFRVLITIIIALTTLSLNSLRVFTLIFAVFFYCIDAMDFIDS
jgi:hypothetical protein